MSVIILVISNFEIWLSVALVILLFLIILILTKGIDKRIKNDLEETNVLTKNDLDLIFPSEYLVDENDENLFHGLKIKGTSIRIINCYLSGKKQSKDSLIFATSLPHKLDAENAKLLLALIPQLTEVDFKKTHELKIFKSPAAKFSELQDSILKYLFFYLYSEYAWLNEEQVVYIDTACDPNCLSIGLKTQTYKHIPLGRMLFSINGIKRNNDLEFPKEMVRKGNYSFILYKADNFDWNDLIPQINEILSMYFIGGVRLDTHKIFE